MSRRVDVHFLPDTLDDAALTGSVAVVVDILRASTTIAAALHSGARCVLPCERVDDARRLASKDELRDCALGGERGGVRIDGFDLGNSPAEYTPSSVGNRPVVFTTTNGTRALLRSVAADTVLLAGFVNLSAIVERLNAMDNPVTIVCAGTDGRITGEDVLYAGALVSRLCVPPADPDRGSDDAIASAVRAEDPGTSSESSWQLSDAARIALSFWDHSVGWRVGDAERPAGVAGEDAVADRIAAAFRHTQGGINLLRLGSAHDLVSCSRLNTIDLVPEYDADSGRITAGRR